VTPSNSSAPLQSKETAEDSSVSSASVVEETIQLLAERVVVERHKRKVAEVIIRKEIETRIVEVPIRREKLIVEQVSPESKQIVVVDLGPTQETEFDAVAAAGTGFAPTVEAKFTSANAAIEFLDAIVEPSSVQSVQVILVLKDANSQALYQRWLDSNQPTSSVAS